MKSFAHRIPRTVIALGVVSLLTDLSSEMIYPLAAVLLPAARQDAPGDLNPKGGAA